MPIYRLENIKTCSGSFSLKINSCSLQRGVIYAVTGPNGCGKSTFLDTLALIRKPHKGEFYFDQEKIDYRNCNGQLLKQHKIGYLLQNPYLFKMSVYDNVAYGLKLKNVDSKIIRIKVNKILAQFSLDHLSKRSPMNLSGGEAQRIALARTLVLDNQVLLLDEPTANVDRNNIRLIEEYILYLNKEKNITVVISTHSQEQAERISKNIISIIDGRIKNSVYRSANVYEQKR
jgi:tungstate transport system ATP-binding protein